MRSISVGSADGDGPGHGVAHDALVQPLALERRHQLRVADTRECAARDGARRRRRRPGRPGSRAPPRRRRPRAEPHAPQRVLERAHRGNASHTRKQVNGWTRTSGLYWLLRACVVLHARRLALQIAQVVQLRAPHPRRAHDFDLLNRRRVQREDALDALAERHLADGERRARAAAVQADDDAFEDLDALLVALAHLHVHADGVARLHRRPLGQLRLLDQLNRAHDSPRLTCQIGIGLRSRHSLATISRSISCSSSSSAAPASRSGRRSSVRASASRFRQRRIVRVVARQQHVRHLHVAGPSRRPVQRRRPRVLRIVEQPAAERILRHRLLVADHAGHQPATASTMTSAGSSPPVST